MKVFLQQEVMVSCGFLVFSFLLFQRSYSKVVIEECRKYCEGASLLSTYIYEFILKQTTKSLIKLLNNGVGGCILQLHGINDVPIHVKVSCLENVQ